MKMDCTQEGSYDLVVAASAEPAFVAQPTFSQPCPTHPTIPSVSVGLDIVGVLTAMR